MNYTICLQKIDDDISSIISNVVVKTTVNNIVFFDKRTNEVCWFAKDYKNLLLHKYITDRFKLSYGEPLHCNINTLIFNILRKNIIF